MDNHLSNQKLAAPHCCCGKETTFSHKHPFPHISRTDAIVFSPHEIAGIGCITPGLGR